MSQTDSRPRARINVAHVEWVRERFQLEFRDSDFDMSRRLFERAAWSILLPLATSCQLVGGRVAVQYIIRLMTDLLDIIRP